MSSCRLIQCRRRSSGGSASLRRVAATPALVVSQYRSITSRPNASLERKWFVKSPAEPPPPARCRARWRRRSRARGPDAGRRSEVSPGATVDPRPPTNTVVRIGCEAGPRRLIDRTLHIGSGGDGRVWLRPDGIECFAGDLSEPEQKVVWATQGVPVADLFNPRTAVQAGTAAAGKPERRTSP